MTKPGNSDHADRPADPADGDPAATEPRDNGIEGTDGTDEPAAPPKAAAAPKDDPEPLMTELEKAPPVREEPVMPTAAEAARRRSDLPRPTVVRVAFYLTIASVVVGLVSAVDLFLSKAELVRSAQTIKTAKPLTAEEAERAVSSLLWLYLVVVLALGAFMVLFVYKAQDGVRRARMMTMIITLILLLFHFYFFSTVYGQISGLFAAIVIALLYLPSTREFFGPRQTTR